MLDDLQVTLFKPPLKVAPASLHFHVESVPASHARNNTSDKNFRNSLYAELGLLANVAVAASASPPPYSCCGVTFSAAANEC